MKDQDLCKELSRKLCKDIGCTPFSIGKVGLTHLDLKIKETLKLQDENGVVKKAPMWYGEALGSDGLMCCLLVGLDPDPDNLEIACVIGFKDTAGNLQEDSVRLGFRYDWTSDTDPGTLIMRAGDKWLEVSLMQWLQIALGFESMVQDGILWNTSTNIPEELKNNLLSIIDIDN